MKLRRAFILTLIFACALSLPAQESAKPHPAEAPAQSSQEKKETQEAERPASGPGAALAEASREAAGEEEGTKEFKQSSSVQWLASITGLSLHGAYWLAVILNFVIIAAAIIFFWRSNVPAALRARTAAIRKGMEDAQRASQEARRRLGEIEQRLAKLDAEIAAMRASAEADAATEEERIRAAAEEDQRKVVETAEQEIAAAARQARRELKAYAADLAVTLAAKRIHLDTNTDQALVRSFVEQLAEPDSTPRKETT